MKKKVKGFTLMEMIIVLALFSIIMYSVIQLLDPVTKYFVRSSNFADTTACQDNMKRCIEGNLKYANRVRAYSGDSPYMLKDNPDGDYPDLVPDRQFLSAKLKSDIRSFYNEFFLDRVCIDSSGTIYVLCFDNNVYAPDLSNFSQLSEYGGHYNTGQITLYQIDFDNYADGILTDLDAAIPDDHGGSDAWAVNQKLYGNFDYNFRLIRSGDFLTSTAPVAGTTTVSSDTTTTITTTTTDPSSSVITSLSDTPFNPADFGIEITMKEIKRVEGDLVREDVAGSTLSSFAMKNVLDSTKMFAFSLRDPVTVLKSGMDETQANCYEVLRSPDRYRAISRNESGTFNGFYFIFTLAETTNTNASIHTTEVSGSTVWIDNVATTAPATTSDTTTTST